MVPILHLSPLNTPAALGVSIAVGMLIYQTPSSTEPKGDRSISIILWEFIGAVLGPPLIALAMGWIVMHWL